MCGGGGGGGADKSLKYQREQDRLAEQRRKEGMALIDAMFGGGTYRGSPVKDIERVTETVWHRGPGAVSHPQNNPHIPDARGPATSTRTRIEGFDESGRYFDAQGNRIRDAERAADLSAAGKLYSSKPQKFRGFDDSFFDKQARAYEQYAMPQVDEQYADAGEAVTYALARQGMLQSSEAVDRFSDLDLDLKRARREVANRGQNLAADARGQLAAERARLTQIVQAGADPSAVSSQSSNVLANLRARPRFDPVGPLFQDATAGLGSYLEGKRFGDMRNRINAAFSPSASSGRVVRG